MATDPDPRSRTAATMNGPACDLRGQLGEVPAPLLYAVIGAAALGLVGAIAGLIVGLSVYVPTAWFAMLELGIPAAMLGALLGVIVGTIVNVVQRIRRKTSGPG